MCESMFGDVGVLEQRHPDLPGTHSEAMRLPPDCAYHWEVVAIYFISFGTAMYPFGL